MTHRERAFAALSGRIPDHVPTFELEFQLAEEFFGKPLLPEALRPENLPKLSAAEKDRLLHEMAEYTVWVYDQLDYSILPLHGVGDFGRLEDRSDFPEEFKTFVKYVREAAGDKPLAYHGDGTFSIPDGNGMYDFAYRTADDPEGLCDEADRMARNAIERNKRLRDMGVDILMLCSDYCYNSGPFLSPRMFGQFIAPYLHRIIYEARKNGQFAIKHTDGNIMPILDQLVDCEPHALHSLDPMAGVDIREVKRLVGDRVALCGNVHCAALQTGTEQDVIDSAEYCLTYGKPGGGYIFCTSNVPFKGMPPERYKLILDVWKRMRDYNCSHKPQ